MVVIYVLQLVEKMMEQSKENVNAKKGATAAEIMVLIVVSIVVLAGG